MTQDLTINRNKIRQFKCNNCGGELELQNKRSQYVACPYCGSVADSSSEAYKVLTKMEEPSKYPPMSFIKMGMEATFNGKVHHVVGRTRRRNTYKEYWREDGESGYSDETWVLDEWQLINEDGIYLTIVEDDEGYYLVKQILPKHPSMPQGSKINNFFTNKSERANEYGDTEIMYFEGESTYMIQIGDKSSYSQYSKDGHSFSAEWRYKEGVVKEIEFFEETEISERELMHAFNLGKNDEADGDYDYDGKPKTRRLKNRYIVLVGGIINIILGIVLMNQENITHSFASEIFLDSLSQHQSWKPVNDSLKSVSYTTHIDLKPDTKVIEIASNMYPLYDSTECLAEFTIISDKNETLFAGTDYSYNYNYNDTLFAEQYGAINQYLLRDSSVNSIDLTVEFKVRKWWTKAASKDQNDISCFVGINEINVRQRDRGTMNIGFGVLLLIIAGIAMYIRRKR